MSERQDSAAIIAADMRQLADDIEAGRAIVGQSVWRSYADRVEEIGTGNMAKLRRVCEQMLELLKAPPGFNGGGMSVELDEEQVVMWRDRFLDALAAPPRNCDIYLTEEAVDAATVTVRDCEACSRIDMEAPCVFCMVRWLLAPAKEGGAR